MWDKRESNALAAVFCNATDRRMATVGFRTSTACCPVKRAPDFHKPDTPKSTLLSFTYVRAQADSNRNTLERGKNRGFTMTPIKPRYLHRRRVKTNIIQYSNSNQLAYVGGAAGVEPVRQLAASQTNTAPQAFRVTYSLP